MKPVRPLEWVAVVAIVLILGAVFLPVPTGDRRPRTSACLSNLKQTGTATLIYLEDNDERYPLRDVWMDVLLPYTKGEWPYNCPLLPKSAYGYAFDSRRSGAKPPPNPARATVLFESVNPIRNASDPLLSLPNPGRHPGPPQAPKAGLNAIAYVDGHAKMIAGGGRP